ncbi:hypothetical protein LA66_07085 [Aureimonas altamirensis]|uniref:Uncharacterized protein n=1 Tax=Aureimonas altamirensis TaxID=370622 RepID=A0A0B1QAA8_9HYPH|nr:hypothetical protein [Aureimonas altamirensis]KHJ56311.1 hypothetical protein LA66_07085 [Aureimonas altamirensis]
MANAIYPKAKEGLLGALNLVTGTVRAVLIDTGTYTYAASHQYLSSVPAGSRIGAPQLLGTKTVLNGTFDAADITFPSVPLGDAAEAILIYVDTGTEGTSPLVAYIDMATGLPVTPNGGNITITWNASGIFTL